jgi:hypothetical protein
MEVHISRLVLYSILLVLLIAALSFVYNLAKVAKQLKVSAFGLRKMMRRLDISSKKAR